MHADERNRAMSEALGQDVYHYHLHVVYIPVVEKKILWTKRCKDQALVGTVKETIMQVSRSKKWESKPAMDENGQPKSTASGKKLLEKSYSVLQDDFYRYMFEAGYTDLQRGERGSTEEHLTVTQFKVEQERKRLAELSVKKENVLDDLESLSLKKEKAEEKLTGIEERTQEAWERLHELAPAVKNTEEFVKNNVSSLEELLPEAGALERAKGYREEKAIPFILKIKKLLLSLYRALIEMRQKYLDLQRSYDRVVRDRDYYSDRLEAAEKENGTLKAAAKDLGRVKRAFGSEQVEAAIAAEQEREAAEAAAQKAERAARFRSRRDAR
jgi:chromosome segregation ATPase